MHVVMLVFALSRREFSEALGQVPRMFLAGPSSLFGLAPPGNTGRSHVGLFTPLPVAADLEVFLKGSSNQTSFFKRIVTNMKKRGKTK